MEPAGPEAIAKASAGRLNVHAGIARLVIVRIGRQAGSREHRVELPAKIATPFQERSGPPYSAITGVTTAGKS
jgi:hypothetical protein